MVLPPLDFESREYTSFAVLFALWLLCGCFLRIQSHTLATATATKILETKNHETPDRTPVQTRWNFLPQVGR